METSSKVKRATYPADHEAGMKVPRGGSMCANCRFLKDAIKKVCSNEYFVKWNGSPTIPGEINAYCSDWYEPRGGPWHEAARS